MNSSTPEQGSPEQGSPEQCTLEQCSPDGIVADAGQGSGQQGSEQRSAEQAGQAEQKEAATTERAKLFQHPDLWRAGQLSNADSRATARTVSSGFPELDEHLPGGGWPEAGLSEVLLPTAGIGELQLLMPLLKQLSRQMRWIAWINPPFIPYAPAMEAAGIDISKILLIHPKTHKDALWSLERATRSGSCAVALAWLDETQLTLKDTRRLQLAAKQGNTLTCLFRPSQAACQSSMAELRLRMDAADADSTGKPETLQLAILKRRQGWPIAKLQLALKRERNRAEIREQLSLWKLWRSGATAVAAEQSMISDPLQSHDRHVEQHVTH